jgi:hypothetical protein
MVPRETAALSRKLDWKRVLLACLVKKPLQKPFYDKTVSIVSRGNGLPMNRLRPWPTCLVLISPRVQATVEMAVLGVTLISNSLSKFGVWY